VRDYVPEASEAKGACRLALATLPMCNLCKTIGKGVVGVKELPLFKIIMFREIEAVITVSIGGSHYRNISTQGFDSDSEQKTRSEIEMPSSRREHN
jgi:hypothetical protein